MIHKAMIMMLAALMCASSPAWPQTNKQQQRVKRQIEEIIRLVGAAHTIEDACHDYKITPQLEAALAALKQPLKKPDVPIDVEPRIASAMADLAVKYGAKKDPKGFCERILADHGPTSPHPVVVPKR